MVSIRSAQPEDRSAIVDIWHAGWHDAHANLVPEGILEFRTVECFWSWLDVDLTPRTRRIFCQPCLDWSERRYHIKGLVGARILDRLLELGWLKCVSGSRALQLTPCGRAGLSEIFQIEFNDDDVPAV